MGPVCDWDKRVIVVSGDRQLTLEGVTKWENSQGLLPEGWLLQEMQTLKAVVLEESEDEIRDVIYVRGRPGRVFATPKKVNRHAVGREPSRPHQKRRQPWTGSRRAWRMTGCRRHREQAGRLGGKRPDYTGTRRISSRISSPSRYSKRRSNEGEVIEEDKKDTMEAFWHRYDERKELSAKGIFGDDTEGLDVPVVAGCKPGTTSYPRCHSDDDDDNHEDDTDNDSSPASY